MCQEWARILHIFLLNPQKQSCEVLIIIPNFEMRELIVIGRRFSEVTEPGFNLQVILTPASTLFPVYHITLGGTFLRFRKTFLYFWHLKQWFISKYPMSWVTLMVESLQGQQ